VATRYKKSDIAKRTKQKLSIMPAGLQQNLSTQEIVDLVEYLASLKKAAP
jgi:cytochrome c553